MVYGGSGTQALSTTHDDENVVDIGTVGPENAADVVDNVVDVGEANVKTLLDVISTNPAITQSELAQIMGVTERTISRQIKKLRDTGVIHRVGSARRGYWEIART